MSAQRLAPAPKLSLADRYDVTITRLAELQILAGNERRSQRQHEQLVDDTEKVLEHLRVHLRGPRS